MLIRERGFLGSSVRSATLVQCDMEYRREIGPRVEQDRDQRNYALNRASDWRMLQAVDMKG